MNILVIIIFFLTFLCTLSSKELPFKAERMITDFRGVVSNGKNIICYGDYGIMTYTLNFGQTWNQLNIGDRYSIKKINNIGNDFIGATEHSLIKSTTNGLTWVNKEIFDSSATVIDMAIVNNTVFLLTNNGVFLADSALNLNSQPLLELDINAEYTELETDGKDMYIIYNKKNLIHYSMDTKQLDTTNLINVTSPSCGNCTNITNLKLSGNTVYVMVNSKVDKDNYLKIVKSDNKGKNWENLTNHLFLNGYYIIDNNTISVIKPKPLYYNNSVLFGPEYIKIDTSHFVIDTSDYSVINVKDGIDRAIYYNSSFTSPTVFNEIINVNTDTLIAVGTNKMIVMSNNGGRTWEMKSFFSSFSEGIDFTSFPTKEIGYVLNRLSFYKTKDGGVTWLPQKYKEYPQFSGLAPSSFYFNSIGQGYIKIVTKNVADTNILVTNDNGETYNLQYNDSSSHFKFDNNYPNGMKFRNGKGLGDIILYVLARSEKDSNGVLSNNYTVLRYDNNFRLIDTVRLNCNVLISTVVTKDSSIICLALNSKGSNKTDSSGKPNDYSYSYFLLKSVDKGKTWDSLKVNVPIYQTLTKSADNINHYYLNSVFSNCVAQSNNYILYPTYSQSYTNQGYNLIYRYDYVNNIFDSVKIPTQLNSYPNTIFDFNSKVVATSNFNNFFYSKNIGGNNPIWDSVKGEDIFTNWDGYNPLFLGNDQDAVLSSHIFNDTSGFLIIGTSRNGIGGKEFKMNIVKLSENTGINSVENPRIDEERVFLWNYEPYPLPGKNIINSKIFWNRYYNIENATINVYGVYGTNTNSKNIKINKIQDYMGILEWDCSDVPSGIYIINISLEGESRSFPVMVVK
ncbi:MAG: hypothetical protein JST20_12445 [Bacteroidetes bacterium]|nr:hypothetical protein [Bacteroidota bacterium]